MTLLLLIFFISLSLYGGRKQNDAGEVDFFPSFSFVVNGRRKKRVKLSKSRELHFLRFFSAMPDVSETSKLCQFLLRLSSP